MTGRALAERRPWLLASLVFGISYWFIAGGPVPGLYQIAWKGAGVGLLAVYAWLHHPSRGAHRIALVMALGALGDMVLEVAFTAGAAAFFAGHLVAIALYLRHGRESVVRPLDKGIAIALVVGVPVLAWLLPADRAMALQVALYALPLGGMAAAAWLSAFPRGRVGAGALMFVASDLLIFARMGPLATSGLPHLLIWPLYYFGQFLICTGVIATLRREGEFSAE